MNQKRTELTSRQIDTRKKRERVLPLCLLGTLSSQGTWLQAGHHENPYSHSGSHLESLPPVPGCPWLSCPHSHQVSCGLSDLSPGRHLSCLGSLQLSPSLSRLPASDLFYRHDLELSLSLKSQLLTNMKCLLRRKWWGFGFNRACYTQETFMSYSFSPGLYFFALTMPVSTTYFIPVMVMEVSAMLVEMITLR